ncbi:unnamed protein product [Adineta steineri]|uniref:Uncharacterized protein n=1 Tax=Adineta steineri TaxID=433720 RepID=A0A814IX93_9BILA|nr:unnamed protein product [Adineta steineri]CAF3900058.1 unnamed protein product [Adineta steineri]
MATVIGAVQSQSWAGTYTPDSSCSTSTCCCLSGQAVVKSLSTNSYTVNSGASGICYGATTFTSILYTSGYAGSMMVNADNDTLSLSSDSRNITVTNPTHPACSGKGYKSGAIAQQANIITLLALFLVGMVINISTK